MTEQTSPILIFILVVQSLTILGVLGMLCHLFFMKPRVGSFRIHSNQNDDNQQTDEEEK